MAAAERKDLPSAFTYADAGRAGLSQRRLYSLHERGEIERIRRGLYQRVDARDIVDTDLVEIARRARHATLCLTSALVEHDLSDANPQRIEVALPRGRRKPLTRAPVNWHLFDPATFDVGRDLMRVDERTTIGIYGPERSIIDAFRMRRFMGHELGNEALRRWLAKPGSQPAALLELSRRFPRTQSAIKHALEILL